MTRASCSVNECPRVHHARGLCVVHYRRLARHGTLEGRKPTPKGERRDCQCQNVTHEHGTIAAYITDKCKCDECRAAVARNSMTYRRNRAYGRWNRGYVRDQEGLQRRIGGLMWLGWPLRNMAREMGVGQETLSDILEGQKWVHANTAAAIRTGFDRCLAGKPRTTVQHIALAKATARRRGYVSPFAWDDIDDPQETPKGVQTGEEPPWTPEEFARDVAVLRSFGECDARIAQRMGVTEGTLKYRLRKVAS